MYDGSNAEAVASEKGVTTEENLQINENEATKLPSSKALPMLSTFYLL